MNLFTNWFSQKQAPIQFPKDLPEPLREQHRVIPFKTTHNFRDIGGYEGANGRKVKWGILYRSDNFHRLDKSQFDTFNALNLKSVVDFRSGFEKTHEPNKFPPNATFEYIELPIFDQANQNSGQNLQQKIRKGDLADVDGYGLMIEANEQFVMEYAEEYKTFLQTVLAAKGAPVLYHCTGGKDRTGFATALLLKIAGVSQEVIFEDYLRSNALILPALKRRLRIYALLRGQKALKVVEQLASVTPAYLQTAFNAIEENYGSFENYLSTALSFSTDEVKQLQSYLLE
ncbi:MAG: tyrosine-protein phosphatase [Chloroflexota bacterium]